jgi:putative oxidoreductase
LLHRLIALYDHGVVQLLRLESVPLLSARVSVGWVMAESGWGKLGKIPDVVEFFRGLGIPAPEIQAPMAAVSELSFGVMLLIGLFTRISAIPLMTIMSVAIITAQRDEIKSASDLLGMSEFLFIALLLVLLVRGGGTWSCDRMLLWKRSRCAHYLPTS